jgi:hypothetical protein
MRLLEAFVCRKLTIRDNDIEKLLNNRSKTNNIDDLLNKIN